MAVVVVALAEVQFLHVTPLEERKNVGEAQCLFLALGFIFTLTMSDP
jgi:hypothetical protein